VHWAGAVLKIVGLPQLVLKEYCYMVWFFMHRKHIAYLQVIEGSGSARHSMLSCAVRPSDHFRDDMKAAIAGVELCREIGNSAAASPFQ
jgi:hypothetical protein